MKQIVVKEFEETIWLVKRLIGREIDFSFSTLDKTHLVNVPDDFDEELLTGIKCNLVK